MEEEACETEYPKDFTSNLKLHRAARKGNVRKIRRLCRAGINPDAVNEQCQSPLFVAALHNKEKAVQLLLTSGADPNHPCYDGSTPMHAACLSCSPTILCLLADAGGNINHHDNRGLLPRDWISYQEEIDKRFKMRKFLEAMRLYAIGTVGDEVLSIRTRSRWNAFMDNIRQFPERRGRQWRRRRWFKSSPQRRRFRPRIPENVSNFFQRLHNMDWNSDANCWRFFQREEEDITQRDTLQSRDIMKVQKETEPSENGAVVNADPEAEGDGCKHQLSDSTYPILTLYVDEREGKLTSTKKKDDIRHLDLVEIKEEGKGSPRPVGCNQRKDTSDGSTVVHSEGMQMPAGRAGTVPEENCSNRQNGHEGATNDSSGARRKQSSTKENNGEDYNQGKSIKEIQEDDRRERETTGTDAQENDRSSTSSDDSCKNRMMEILEDAFKLELAPKVSDLMAEYCDSTQGSTAAQESFDIDFQSYHGDDPEDQADVDAVKFLGDGGGSANSKGAEEPDATEGGISADDDRNGFDPEEIELDHFLLKDAADASEDEDEDDRNFIKEGRYVDVQKMLSANLEIVFPEELADAPVSPGDLNNNMDMKESQQDGCEEGDVTNGSSLYQVSALNEAAFISDLSLEVNVTESLKSSLESVPQPQENDENDDEADYARDDVFENAPLRSALAKLDLTQAEKQEVQEWFGGHGSVRNLIHNYESKIQEIQCDTLRSNVTCLGALLRREYAMMDQKNTQNARRTVSDTAALQQHQQARPHATRSDCPRVRHPTDVQRAQPLGIPDVDPDDSWLWPASGEEDTPFEEQLRRSMETIGLDDDGDNDGAKGAESGRGDADMQLADLKKLVSPPPPTCTPEERSPRPTPDNQADSSTASHVNNSGDCETAEVDQGTEEADGETYKALTPPFASQPTSSRAEAELTPKFSPPSIVSKKLVKIDVIRSPTVEAIHNTSD